MTNSKETQLEEKGYKFSGVYTRDKTEAKQRAEKFRAEGKRATVVHIFPSRYSRFGSDGYSVYVKEAQ